MQLNLFISIHVKICLHIKHESRYFSYRMVKYKRWNSENKNKKKIENKLKEESGEARL